MDLLIAIDLAMLTYALGVLMWTLPIPYRGVKVWGPRLIADAAMAAVLASSVYLIMYAGDYLLRVLGVNWPSFYDWLTELTATLTSVFAGLTYASSLVRSTPYSFISRPLAVAASFFATSFTSLKMIYLLSSFIYVYREKLASLGVVLYALPFRVGKSAGSFLIAASIVMYVGFPLMPSFVSAFQSISNQMNLGLGKEYRYEVVDLNWNPIPYPIMKFYTDRGREHLVGEVLGDRAGSVVIGGSKDALPRIFHLYTTIGFAGFEFVPTPESVTSNSSFLLLRVPSLLLSAGSAIVIPAKTVIEGWGNHGGEAYVVVKESPEGGILIVDWGGNASILIDGEAVGCAWSLDNWNSLKLRICNVKVGQGRHNITLSSNKARYDKPRIEEKRLVYLDSVMDVMSSILATSVSYLYITVFLPGAYLGLLTSVSAGLSRALGGGRLKLI